MRKLYESVKDILARLNFDDIWAGFSQMPFALFNDNEVYLENGVIPRDDRFYANTVIEFDGGLLAIWTVDEPDNEDSEILASGIVHEMFHGFQNVKGERRGPEELILLRYPDDRENFRLKHIENRLLAKVCLESSLTEKMVLFRRFMALRKYREELIGEIIRCEYLTETCEGMAEYAGTMALKQISPQKYSERIKRYTDMMLAADDRIFHIRRISYYIGTLMCVAAGELGLPLAHDIGGEKKTVFELLSDGVLPEQAEKTEYDPAIDSAYDNYFGEKQKQFDDFLESEHTRTEGEFKIRGFDPMNMVRIGDRILNARFVMLLDMKTNEMMKFFEPVLLDMSPGSDNIAVAYMKLTESVN